MEVHPLVVWVSCLLVLLVVVSLVVLLWGGHALRSALSQFAKRLADPLKFTKGEKGILSTQFRLCTGPSATTGVALHILEVCDALHGAVEGSAKDAQGPWTLVQSDVLPYFAAVGTFSQGGSLSVVVSFRGTADHIELLNNDFGEAFMKKDGTESTRLLIAAGLPMPFPPQVALDGSKKDSGHVPMVSESFYYSYVGAIQGQVEKAVLSKLSQTGAPKVVVGGHSLGAGVACICAVLLQAFLRKEGSAAQVELCVAATPKPGNAAFRDLLAAMKCTSYANETDIVPWNPSSVVPDLTRASGLLEYVMPPGLCVFSVVAPTLTGCHAVASYRRGIAALGGAPSAQ